MEEETLVAFQEIRLGKKSSKSWIEQNEREISFKIEYVEII